MSRLISFATIAGALMLAGTASAQYYEPYRGRGEYREDYRRGPPRGYDDDRYERRSYRPARRFSSMCVTSRGTCETAPQPYGTGCRCHIEGFGPKRGAIQ
ncbi:hypothetical protein [Bosea sp. PAMC 26642]|uniref:hypothetical protein n=1 Tax=Bosea sp. (strain PAMC 26642) TaxID=1792307 RepID=UPI0012E72E98|nr:hypothetical protein [Bosea sp. PAMC 26642]